jgi:hypothetical protein
VLTSVAVNHFPAVARFREAIDALASQGFLRKDGTGYAIGPDLLRAWILGDLVARLPSGDPWCDWVGTDPDNRVVQTLPRDRKPISLQKDNDEAWFEVVREIRQMVMALRG